MIIKAKETIYKRKGSSSVLVNLQIEDINSYFDRFNNSLIVNFGVFQFIDNQRILVDNIQLVLTEDMKRTGYVLLPDEEGTGNTGRIIEEYFAEYGNLDGVVRVLDYGMPTPEIAKSFFTGGDSLDNPEIHPANDLAKEWLLNTIKFDGELIKENFEFKN